MNVELLHNTPLWVCAKAIRKCWASEDKSDTHTVATGCIGCYALDSDGSCSENVQDTCNNYDNFYTTKVAGDKDKELINRVGNKNKHKSTLEHLVYTFDVDGISRACLQELARHRIASYSVKSTRYTLKELKDYRFKSDLENDAWKFLVQTEIELINRTNINALLAVHTLLHTGQSNDKIKYILPEAYKTSLVMTINARSLQNFIELRSSKSALWEIQNLAKAMFDAIPDEHIYLFKEYINEK